MIETGLSRHIRGLLIFVVGSLNVDLIQKVPRLPLIGETMHGSDLHILSGGKGANQACAAARLGGVVSMAGKVGNDAFGERLKEDLQRAGVDTRKVATSPRMTGAATIFVLPDGGNSITISAGANGDIDGDTAVSAIAGGTTGDLLLCQLETPMQANGAVLKAARERQMITILDPAPAQPLSRELLAHVSILTPNQTEALALLNKQAKPSDSMEDARQLAEALLACGPVTVILKLGERGCLVAQAQGCVVLESYRVSVVDTTGAGDTFNGALAVALSEGKSIEAAAKFANAAAALSVTKFGAMDSSPTRQALNQFLAQSE